MSRVGSWYLLALAIGGCNGRPLPNTPRDGAVVDAVSPPEVDGPIKPRPVADAWPADAPADVGVDAPLRDAPVDSADAGADTAPHADARTDTGAAPDATPPPDGPCSAAGNGRTPQAGPLFGKPVTFPIPDGLGVGGANATAIGIGDVTGDGRADVLVGSYHPAIVVYPQMADGSLGSPVKYPIAPGGPHTHPALLDVGDLDGDGYLDVVFPRQDGIGIVRGRAGGGFGPEQVLPKPPEAISVFDLAIADLDGDGRQDLAAMPYLSNGVEVRLQNATGSLASAGFFRCPGKSYSRMAIGDTDGDGRADIVLGIFGGDLCLVRQRAGGGFDDGVAIAVNGQVNGLAVGNFGAVGCGPAIACALYGNRPKSQLGFFSRSTAGVSTPLTLLGAHDLPAHLVAVDVDDDGRQDVVMMHVSFQLVGVFRALPTGGLAAEELYPFSWINDAADRLAVGDVNSDGRPDVVSADFELSILYHR